MPGGHARRALARQGVRAGALLAGLATVVWATGLPLLFPSLGPTAYLFVTRPAAPECRPRRVLGGHAIGVLAGLVAYHVVAGEGALTAVSAPWSAAAGALAASGVLAVALTTAGMLATDTGHAPACATTLIVALGLLSRPLEGALMILAVAAMVAERALLVRVV